MTSRRSTFASPSPRSPQIIATRRAFLGVCALFGLLIAASQADAYARDADGTRHQARHHALGDTQRDTLSPPHDAVDWRSIKLSEGKTLNVSARHKPEDVRLRVALVDSAGVTLAESTSTRGVAALSAALKPGLYYVSVACDQGVSYSVTIQ